MTATGRPANSSKCPVCEGTGLWTIDHPTCPECDGTGQIGTAGARRIVQERHRQIRAEGYDPINDANDHDPEDLEQAALAYLTRDADKWPWINNPKFGPTRLRELEKAGALIAAAIDIRLFRNER